MQRPCREKCEIIDTSVRESQVPTFPPSISRLAIKEGTDTVLATVRLFFLNFLRGCAKQKKYLRFVVIYILREVRTTAISTRNQFLFKFWNSLKSWNWLKLNQNQTISVRGRRYD